MEKYDVAVTPCDSYEKNEVEKSLKEAIDAVNGLDFVKSGMKVAIKMNLVAPMKPDAAATVHPSVVCAIVKMLREKGAEVVIGDSPGGVYSASYLKVVYDVCGIKKAEEYGAVLNSDFSIRDVEYPEAVCAKKFQYTSYLDKADAIVDLCKLKSHGMMGMTCAVKNFFGTVPGLSKPQFHYAFPKSSDFANVLIDLYEYSKPVLCICDAVTGMEGNGPTQGTPRKIGCLLASKNGHMLDLVASGIIGMNTSEIPTLEEAVKRGLIPEDALSLSVYGEPGKYRQDDFKTNPAQSDVFFKVLGGGVFGRITDFVAGRILTPYPGLDKNACIGCSKCAGICPAKAITMKKKRPVIDRSKCIHCFCCQEFCPKGAMKVRETAISKMLTKKKQKKKK